MCNPTIAAAVTPHIPVFIWISGLLGAVMFGASLHMFWQSYRDARSVKRVRQRLEQLARETA